MDDRWLDLPWGVLMIHGDRPLRYCCSELRDAVGCRNWLCSDGGLVPQRGGKLTRSCPFCHAPNVLRYDTVGSDDGALVSDIETLTDDLKKLCDRLCDIRDQAEESLHELYELTCERFGRFAKSSAWCAEEDVMSGLNDITWSLGIWYRQITDGARMVIGEGTGDHDGDGGPR